MSKHYYYFTVFISAEPLPNAPMTTQVPVELRVHRAHQSVLAQGSGSLVAAVPTQLTTAPWPWFSCCCYYVCTGFSFVARLACSLLFSLGYTRCPDPPASVTSVCNHV